MVDKNIIKSFHEGHCLDAYKVFGSHFVKEKGINGVRFNVYAPNAKKVFVVGSFNDWQNTHMMNKLEDGVFSIFIAGLKQYDMYKYRIFDENDNYSDKADPYSYFNELRPNTSSFLYDLSTIKWSDKRWLNKRSKNFDKPVNIYEVYAGGWKRKDGRYYSFVELKEELIPYVLENGFTHIEFMPLNEFPFDGSWGYQASGYYSCTSRFGNPHELAEFINEAHKKNIGIIIDMAFVHFVKDSHGLRLFDGKPLYEYPNEFDANSQWGTLNFNLWNEEVRSFLMSSASFWCDTYHVDGIRFDAVSNLIFWDGNKDRGTNEGALAFIKRMNFYLNQKYPSVMLIAEDSSDFEKVCDSTIYGGLGFDYKWDLGWMNDTLKYYETDPIYRIWEHHKLTFSMAYFYSEKFILPLSHDEVVHGKKTIIDKMWGDYNQKFSQVKNLYAYMFTHPGKKLNFMGNEFAMFREFDENRGLDWDILNFETHQKFARYFKDLNLIYKAHNALSKYDYQYDGFKWIDADNSAQSIYSYTREDEKEYMVCLFNMCPNSYSNYEIGVKFSGEYKEILNSEWDIYGGINFATYCVNSEKIYRHGHENTIKVNIAPFSASIFLYKKKKVGTKNV